MKQVFIALLMLFAPSFAHSQGVTIPVYNGQPYFQAALTGSNQTVVTATATKVQFNTVNFDSCSCYDNATNFRYNPKVAGKYLVTVSVTPVTGGGTGGATMGAFIYKNGANAFQSSFTMANTNGFTTGPTVTAIVALNGSTDYVEGWAESTGTSGTVIFASSAPNTSWFQAVYLGP